MSIDIKLLKKLARKVAELEDQPEREDEHAEAADELWLNMHCHTILGLIKEIERRDENPNFRAVRSARQEAEKLKAENEALRSHIQKGVGLMPLGTARRASWVMASLSVGSTDEERCQ
ncbi:hypothetical protein [Pseudomonas sp. C5pp]|uniref:hypothetical protein n=1 Tax=Pseudomonas sp. C5pp TaxID=1586081 RepID=UPI0005803F07|nr:hypothetical protein [Pseudomonas sp. C5pp]KIC79399.1 hypothetical protein RR51_27020 [Pseudomonas sp. C5pp]